MKIDEAVSLIRAIPDYPKPGILFQDITPLLADGAAFSAVTDHFAQFVRPATSIAGIEARGFIFASALANKMKAGFVPIRKAGKLPHTTFSQSYGLEYGTDVLEIHVDAIPFAGQVLLIDDVLATGGTLDAAIQLVNRAGGSVYQILALLEIQALEGRSRLAAKYPQIPVHSLVVS
jgi:adenine phosphoribosyltransferase